MAEPSTKERRRVRRILQRIPASFRGKGVKGRGHIKNISEDGLFLRVDKLPSPGEQVRILIEPENGPKVEVLGTVCWTTAQLPSSASAALGFGFKLAERTEEFKDLFERILLQ